NWRSVATLDEYLKSQNVIGISEVSTRALVRHLRERGVMRAVIAHGEAAENPAELVRMAQDSPDMSGWNLVDDVTAPEAYHWTERSAPQGYRAHHHDPAGPLTVAYDCGIKRTILRIPTDRGWRVTVAPAQTPASEVLAL